MADIAEIVLKTVAEASKRSLGEITLNTLLAEDLMLKSVNRIELGALLEDRLNVPISNFDILKPKCVGDIVKMVQSKMK